MRPGTNRTNKRGIVFIAFLVVAISLFYYLTFFWLEYYTEYVYYHTLFRDLYFLPLVLAGFWFGLKGALHTSLFVTLLYLPFIILNWQHMSPSDFNRILEVCVFNAVAAVLGIVSDREKAREKALRESESLAAIGRTVSAIAHDMRNPLTVIGGFTQLVRDRLPTNDDDYRRLGLVMREADRLEGMVKDMLDFSRPLDLILDRESVSQVVSESIALVERRAKEKEVRLESRLSGETSPVAFDAARMERVLSNLIQNAIEASPAGGLVLVRTFLSEDMFAFEVIDNGPGIPPEKREEIFFPFFTTKKEGTGLGLAIVTRIVRAHGGEVGVRENPEGGSIFRVMLPIGS
jgi:signal transduction histidine kinase